MKMDDTRDGAVVDEALLHLASSLPSAPSQWSLRLMPRWTQMDKRAVLRCNHFQTLAVTKEHLPKGYFFSSMDWLSLVLQKNKDNVACYPGSLDQMSLQQYSVLPSHCADPSQHPQTAKQTKAFTDSKFQRYDGYVSPSGNRNTYLNVMLHSDAI